MEPVDERFMELLDFANGRKRCIRENLVKYFIVKIIKLRKVMVDNYQIN